MDQKLKDYWNNNKLMFFLVVIPITLGLILFTLRDLIFAMLAGSARKTAEEARKEDSKLQEVANQAELDAVKSQAEADAAAKRVEDRKEGDISEDWNKKG